MRDAGFSLHVRETKRPGDAGEAAARSCAAAARVLVVAGGDGTINEVVGGMRGEGVPILVVPTGTENILARYLGLRAKANALWEAFRHAREVQLDVAERDGRRFILVGGIGFDAQAVLEVTRVRGSHISYLTYFWPLWRTLWGYRQPRMTVTLDESWSCDVTGLVLVGNVPRYALGLRLWPQASPNDGLLDVCILKCTWPGALLRHAMNVMLRRHVGKRGVIYRQARRVRVSGAGSVPVQLDGDVAGWLPAEFTMTADRARFIVPPGWRDLSPNGPCERVPQ
jgi:YegS/Rv2252/BmrU family lipid kinase